jgi:hypothetical protein
MAALEDMCCCMQYCSEFTANDFTSVATLLFAQVLVYVMYLCLQSAAVFAVSSSVYSHADPFTVCSCVCSL